MTRSLIQRLDAATIGFVELLVAPRSDNSNNGKKRSAVDNNNKKRPSVDKRSSNVEGVKRNRNDNKRNNRDADKRNRNGIKETQLVERPNDDVVKKKRSVASEKPNEGGGNNKPGFDVSEKKLSVVPKNRSDKGKRTFSVSKNESDSNVESSGAAA